MRIIVTGGNSGVGKATATALAAAGHRVVIACRTIPKAEQAAAEMVGDVEVRYLDLADLTSVHTFADSVETVDVLVNNAGVLGLPLTRTADGFEAHMGTNYLGHFALTCLLGDKIKDRVVSVGSMNYMFGRIHLDDLNCHTRKYSMWAAYATRSWPSCYSSTNWPGAACARTWPIRVGSVVMLINGSATRDERLSRPRSIRHRSDTVRAQSQFRVRRAQLPGRRPRMDGRPGRTRRDARHDARIPGGPRGTAASRDGEHAGPCGSLNAPKER